MVYLLKGLNNRLPKLIVIMKNKNNIYVEVESKEQAEIFKKVLEAMGEPISTQYFPFKSGYQLRLSINGNWLLGEENNELSKITFGELIDLLQRKPLLISEDGVPLYGDEDIFMCCIDSNTGKPKYKKSIFINSCNYTSKIFISESKALEWIESQKPKFPIVNKTKKEVVTEIEIEFNNESSVLITKYNLKFSGNVFDLTQLEVMDIFDKFKSLQNA